MLDAQGAEVARAGALTGTEWRVSEPLLRGRTYSWRVTSDGRTETASFRVLGDAELSLLMQVRAWNAGSHLALGVVAYQFGLLRDAEREFEARRREVPPPSMAAKGAKDDGWFFGDYGEIGSCG